MLRKSIEKLNKIILWTKQWHFFHVLFVGTIISLGLFVIVSVCGNLVESFLHPENFSTEPLDDSFNIGNIDLIGIFAFMITLFSFPMFFLGAIAQLYINIKRNLMHKKVFALNSFFVNNKKYDYFYNLSLLIVVFSLISVFTSSEILLLVFLAVFFLVALALMPRLFQ